MALRGDSLDRIVQVGHREARDRHIEDGRKDLREVQEAFRVHGPKSIPRKVEQALGRDQEDEGFPVPHQSQTFEGTKKAGCT